MGTEHNSTSSIQTGPLKRPRETIALGKHIVEELELDESTDTLSKWLSHYLAENIMQAETELDNDKKDQLEQKCCKLIMELWSRRSNLPANARPTGHLEDVLLAIRKMEPIKQDSLIPHREREKELKSIWLKFANEAYTLEKKVWLTSFLVGMMESNFGREQSWIDNHNEFLGEEERKLLNTFKSWLASLNIPWHSEDESETEEPSPDNREKLVLEEIDKALIQLNQAVDQLKDNLHRRGT